MTVKDIFTFLDSKFPCSLAMPFDNVGLLVGNENAEVNNAVIALDCTEKVLNFAVENNANLIITHHPLIFNPLKTVTSDSIVYRLIENGISLISMHTNLDTAPNGLNDLLANTLKLENTQIVSDNEGFTFRIGDIFPVSSDTLANTVANKLSTHVKYTSGCKEIKRVAVCSGSGGEFWELSKENGADALVTADVKHNYFADADNNNFTLIDAGHFETENIAVNYLKDLLSEKFISIKFIGFTDSFIKYL